MMRQVPLHVPAGWTPKRWAGFCDHMQRACRDVRPEISLEWKQAKDFADAMVNQANPDGDGNRGTAFD